MWKPGSLAPDAPEPGNPPPASRVPTTAPPVSPEVVSPDHSYVVSRYKTQLLARLAGHRVVALFASGLEPPPCAVVRPAAGIQRPAQAFGGEPAPVGLGSSVGSPQLLWADGFGLDSQIPQILDDSGWTANGKAIGYVVSTSVDAQHLAHRAAIERGRERPDYAWVGSLPSKDLLFQDTPARVVYLSASAMVAELLRDPLASRFSVILVDFGHSLSNAPLGMGDTSPFPSTAPLSMGLVASLLRKLSKSPMRDDLRLVPIFRLGQETLCQGANPTRREWTADQARLDAGLRRLSIAIERYFAPAAPSTEGPEPAAYAELLLDSGLSSGPAPLVTVSPPDNVLRSVCSLSPEQGAPAVLGALRAAASAALLLSESTSLLETALAGAHPQVLAGRRRFNVALVQCPCSSAMNTAAERLGRFFSSSTGFADFSVVSTLDTDRRLPRFRSGRKLIILAAEPALATNPADPIPVHPSFRHAVIRTLEGLVTAGWPAAGHYRRMGAGQRALARVDLLVDSCVFSATLFSPGLGRDVTVPSVVSGPVAGAPTTTPECPLPTAHFLALLPLLLSLDLRLAVLCPPLTLDGLTLVGHPPGTSAALTNAATTLIAIGARDLGRYAAPPVGIHTTTSRPLLSGWEAVRAIENVAALGLVDPQTGRPLATLGASTLPSSVVRLCTWLCWSLGLRDGVADAVSLLHAQSTDVLEGAAATLAVLRQGGLANLLQPASPKAQEELLTDHGWASAEGDAVTAWNVIRAFDFAMTFRNPALSEYEYARSWAHDHRLKLPPLLQAYKYTRALITSVRACLPGSAADSPLFADSHALPADGPSRLIRALLAGRPRAVCALAPVPSGLYSLSSGAALRPHYGHYARAAGFAGPGDAISALCAPAFSAADTLRPNELFTIHTSSVLHRYAPNVVLYMDVDNSTLPEAPAGLRFVSVISPKWLPSTARTVYSS
ncbi:hypothetical protein H696_03715 [Fonticula alba]|uniref:Uncharacterized protein n=1 Tax=Fonticula alba TaxID=691883 RepID=A0A058Z4S7_FONAL|nr:hypothetical protein H696_03715 [Fonticula alba]KCV69280.1 hypothetical protein H696_03715 [Fonticula alba]|eukprot:XP_009495845.1 hypothetical protein H696_03715 [Fonticula alba]